MECGSCIFKNVSSILHSFKTAALTRLEVSTGTWPVESSEFSRRFLLVIYRDSPLPDESTAYQKRCSFSWKHDFAGSMKYYDWDIQKSKGAQRIKGRRKREKILRRKRENEEAAEMRWRLPKVPWQEVAGNTAGRLLDGIMVTQVHRSPCPCRLTLSGLQSYSFKRGFLILRDNYSLDGLS